LKTFLLLLAFVALFAFCGCAEKSGELADDTKSVKKLSPEEAKQFKSILPGSRKSQKAEQQQAGG
jgi:hypothetical protein